MNNYIMKSISIRGTEVEFLEAIRDFFTTNTVMTFELEEENLKNAEDEANYIKLTSDDYKLEFISDLTTDESKTYNRITVTLYKNDENKTYIFTNNFFATIESSNNNNSVSRLDSCGRLVPLFIVKGEDMEFMFIGSGTDVRYGKSNGFYYIKAATSEVGYIYGVANSTTNNGNNYTILDYETNSISYTPTPNHVGTTVTDMLIMDSELPLTLGRANSYCGTMLGCYGLGGGVDGTFYRDADGTLLYCFMANCCIKLDNKVDA